MAGLHVRSLLVTGANRGIGLGLVQHFLRMSKSPQWIFAGCRDPKGQRAQAFLPLLKKAAQGSPGSGLSCSKAAIVNMSSIGGSISSSFGWELMHVTSYRCSKAALNMLSKCQSLAYKEHGILCVALHPGWVQTDMGRSAGHPAFLPLLKKAAQGSPGSGLSCSKAAIVNMSSIGGSISSSFGWELMHVTSYRCSKAALNMLSKCQSLAYKEHGILCVALHPGWVQTDMGRSAGHP
ncbi:hypothetical protein HGM15179_022282, partial [Zosterops borbonicus]